MRGAGLLLAALLDAPIASEVAREALSLGLVVNAVTPTVILIASAFTSTEQELTEAVGRFVRALAVVNSQHPDASGGVSK